MSSLSKIYELKDLDFDGLDEDNDFMIALQIQMQLDNESEDHESNPDKSISLKSQSHMPPSLIGRNLHDPEWDYIDPCPDIRAMFQEFDKLYFWNRLGSCIVEWSKRMTICAGIFYLREGGIIRLSEPLLKFRPRKDLVDTLLHEMIHAYLYLTRNFKDRGEHGDEFKSHMDRINRAASTRITVYHSFHDEVNHARQHVWRCTGVCRTMPPFYGYVKRSMNRAPGKNDTWWAQHQSKCNGTFEKISEPESYKQKQVKGEKSILDKSSNDANKTIRKKKDPALLADTSNMKKLDSYFGGLTTKTKSESILDSKNTSSSVINAAKITDNFKKRKSEDDVMKELKTSQPSTCSSNDIIFIDDDWTRPEKMSKSMMTSTQRTDSPEVIDLIDEPEVKIKHLNLVECPICFQKFSANCIESHVNTHF
jgi:predicted SprT family Zn-dependent metalloprotease